MFSKFREFWLRQKTRSAGSEAYLRAGEQIKRAQQESGSTVIIDGDLQAGEAELLSLTSQATAAVESRYGKHLNKIADGKSEIGTQNAVLCAQIERMDSNEHIVSTEHGGAAVSGDRQTLPQMRADHDALTAQIAVDTEAGITRHAHKVKRVWRIVANSILLIDVVALFMLMLTIENTSFGSLIKNPGANTAKFITAAGFSLMGALVLAAFAHQLGQSLWRRIHRRGNEIGEHDKAGDDGHPQRKARNMADHVLVLGIATVVIVALAAVVAASIFHRIGIAAGTSEAAPLAPWIGVAIGIAVTVAPLIVASVEAMAPSPEVARRDALAGRITAEDKRKQSLEESLAANYQRLSSLDVEAGRILVHADRELQDAMLPATQLILKLRSEFGHAGEMFRPVTLPSPVEGSVAIGWDNLERLRMIVPPTEQIVDVEPEPSGPHPLDDDVAA